MITFSNRKPEEMLLPFCDGPVLTTEFFFTRHDQEFSGRIDYEWFNLMGEDHLIIHSVLFDKILSTDVQRLIDPLLYGYLVECAKMATKFD